MAMKENRIQYISKTELKLGDISYIEKNKVYFLEKNDSWKDEGRPPTHLIYNEEDALVFTINNELIEEYFMSMAEYRDTQINSILE